MRGGVTRGMVLWAAASVGCYLVGSLLLLTVMLTVWTREGLRPELLTTARLAMLAASFVLFSVGGYATNRVRARRGPPESSLPDRFKRGAHYVDDRERGDGRREEGGRPNHILPDESGHDTVRCPHCGARNDPDFRFCGECSGELDD